MGGASSPKRLAMFDFLGKLFGISIRTKNPLALDLPSLVWKKLTFTKPTRSDIEAVHSIEQEGVTADMFGDIIQETFTVMSTDGRVVELEENGAQRALTWDARQEWADAVLDYRIHEYDVQINAIARGMATLVPTHLLALFEWQELELLVCGRSFIDVKVLKQNTRYQGCSPTDAHILMFWEVLEEMTQAELRLFLRFVWGRSRLPTDASGWTQKFTIAAFSMGGDGDDMDGYLPISHTCFNTLDLVPYSCKEVMREKLVYAMSTCVAVDGDFVVR